MNKHVQLHASFYLDHGNKLVTSSYLQVQKILGFEKLETSYCNDHNIHCIQGFDEHIRGHHCMWNYIYYYVYLDSIEPRDRTAIEKQVYSQVTTCSLDHVPVSQLVKVHGKDALLSPHNGYKWSQ